jgi:hypothetical protein
MLENVRFDARETSKVAEERAALAAEWAQLGDLYVSDGFGGYTGSLGDAYFGFVLHAGNISGFNGTYYGWVQFSDEPLSDNDDQYGGAPIMWIQTIVTSTVNNASVTVGTTT